MSNEIFHAEAPDWDLYHPQFSTFSKCARDLLDRYEPEDIASKGFVIVETREPWTTEQREASWTPVVQPDGRITWISGRFVPA